jgi:1-acyl-sn-glycerol-3-phosphate acyltransferase
VFFCPISSKESKVASTLISYVRLGITFAAAIFATLVLAPPLILLSLIDSGQSAYYLTRLWVLMVSKAMGLSFSIKGIEKVVPGTSYIVTPNHQSNVDIFGLLLKLPFRYRWVLKKELLKIPLWGWAVARTGSISLDRGNPRQAVERLRESTGRLSQGWSVVIYPEGTRTRDGHLGLLKKGAFMMAVQTGIPILPVTSNGAFKIMPKKTLHYRPGHVTITIGDPIATEGLTEKDVPELMEKTRAAIAAHLDPDYDPFRQPNSDRATA